MAHQNILLIEPSYPNKYPPLGLMKLAAHHGPHGAGDQVHFTKGSDHRLLHQEWHRVYVTTLFSFEWDRTAAAIDFALQAAHNPRRVFVGGIAASLMPDAFRAEPRWKNIRFIPGLLDRPPQEALGLLPGETTPFDTDPSTPAIDAQIPDYSILAHIPRSYPVNDAYFGYASRGCIRKCSFCGVPALEGDLKDAPPLHNLVQGVHDRHGPMRDLILMDNNVVASPRYREIIAEIRDLGFTPGAKLTRPGTRPQARRVDFNQGIDARILAKSPMYLREMATIAISPLRIAFDHTGLTKVYRKAVTDAAHNGITSLSNYMLYNFFDSPADLYNRLKTNIDLNQELGINIWSFPMRYQPVTLKTRSHTGPNWSRYTLRSLQIILQATRGVVTGNPDFFHHAFGPTADSFHHLLTQPHAFIFHRNHFTLGPGAPIAQEYNELRDRLSPSQEDELLQTLSQPPPPGLTKAQHLRRAALHHASDPLVARALRYHILDTSNAAKTDSERLLQTFTPPLLPPLDHMTEDAGLNDPTDFPPQAPLLTATPLESESTPPTPLHTL